MIYSSSQKKNKNLTPLTKFHGYATAFVISSWNFISFSMAPSSHVTSWLKKHFSALSILKLVPLHLLLKTETDTLVRFQVIFGLPACDWLWIEGWLIMLILAQNLVMLSGLAEYPPMINHGQHMIDHVTGTSQCDRSSCVMVSQNTKLFVWDTFKETLGLRSGPREK